MYDSCAMSNAVMVLFKKTSFFPRCVFDGKLRHKKLADFVSLKTKMYLRHFDIPFAGLVSFRRDKPLARQQPEQQEQLQRRWEQYRCAWHHSQLRSEK